MSIFKRKFIKEKMIINRGTVRNSLISCAFLLSTTAGEVLAKDKNYVAVEPLTCDLVKAISPSSNKVTCLVKRKQDVHDLKITPRQANILNSADRVFTLGKEMTPAVRNLEKKSNTVVVGVNAIDVENPSNEEANSFEWAGTFELSKGNYTWSFAKVEGEYADPAMKMVILEASDIEESEDYASELLESDNSVNKSNSDVLIASNKAYILNFDERKDKTVFNVEIKKKGKYTFFTEHMPFEFEANEHFFKDIAKADVEPIAQFPSEGDGHHHHHHHGHGSLDPHVWHDPNNLIKMSKVISKNIKKDISFFNREERSLLNDRSNKVTSILENLNNWTFNQISTIPASNRLIVSKHKAMDYYGAAFGFETISLLDVLGDSSSLRPQEINSVLKVLKEGNVKVLFSEQNPSSKLLKNLSRLSSVPLSKDQIFTDGLMLKGNTVSVAIHNTCTIVNSLGGQCNLNDGEKLENEWNVLIK